MVLCQATEETLKILRALTRLAGTSIFVNLHQWLCSFLEIEFLQDITPSGFGTLFMPGLTAKSWFFTRNI
ncbi:hypothetical protein J5N97_013860 [Dioscorea zingiberensis]|uniref:Uncharacterized protein n=1 Tax=Dioscorea zingiberensis TaxID=325984 RepID=A0A9D5CRK9_9LILI|nr:hypothetical protein J5N97_013860 [Dioscorea zingiberensis]